jgi:hypothetical protein
MTAATVRGSGGTKGARTLADWVVKLQPAASNAASVTQYLPKILGQPPINCLEPLKRKP